MRLCGSDVKAIIEAKKVSPQPDVFVTISTDWYNKAKGGHWYKGMWVRILILNDGNIKFVFQYDSVEWENDIGEGGIRVKVIAWQLT